MRPRFYEAAPELLLAAGLTLFLLDETDAATSAFASSRALAIMAGASIAWIAARALSWRFTRWPLARTGAFALAAIGALSIVVLPAYRNRTVVETFPVTASGATAEPPPATTVPSTAGAPAPTSAPPSTAPMKIATSMLRGIDHRASGTVAVYQRGDASIVIGLEDIDIQPGPDYDVYVVPGDDARSKDGGTRLDDLRGNRGTQYYEAHDSFAIDASAWTVLVWCQTFGVPVANATVLIDL